MVITCYDETNKDARAVNLTTQVGTITIVPVNFSYPAGSFRVESNLVFTHFTASVTAASGNHVFKITGFTAINEKVIEYYYQLDYLKDYWFRYNVNGSLIIPHTLLISEFSTNRPNEYNYPIDTKVTSIIESVTKFNNGNVVHKSCPVIVMKSCGIDSSSPHYSVQDTNNKAINPAGIYILEDVDCLPTMWAQVIKSYPQFKNNIENTFYVPVSITEIVESDEEHISKTQTDSVYYISNTGDTASATFTDITGKLNHLILNKSNGIIEVSKDTGIGITINDANDLPPYKKYKLYIPYIGWYDLPLNDIILQHYGIVLNLNVIYLIDICNGMIAAQFSVSYVDGDDYITEVSNYRTPFTYLPKYYFLISDYATESQMNQISKNNGEITNVISSLGALIPAFINPSLAIPSAVSAATNMVNSSINNNIRYQQNQAQASLSNFTSGRDNMIGQIDRQFKLYVDNYYCSLSKNEAAVLTGYPVNKYIGGITPVQNEKYWMDFSSTQITGPEWYVEGVKSEWSKEYVTLC